MNTFFKTIFTLVTLFCMLFICSCGLSEEDVYNLRYQHYEEIYHVEMYYSEMYDTLLELYQDLYYSYKEDPGRTISMDNFVAPEEVETPLDSYLPENCIEPEP